MTIKTKDKCNEGKTRDAMRVHIKVTYTTGLLEYQEIPSS